MRNISRRDFLKGAAAAAVTTATLSLTGIPAFAEEAKAEEKETLVPSSTVDCDASSSVRARPA